MFNPVISLRVSYSNSAYILPSATRHRLSAPEPPVGLTEVTLIRNTLNWCHNVTHTYTHSDTNNKDDENNNTLCYTHTCVYRV